MENTRERVSVESLRQEFNQALEAQPRLKGETVKALKEKFNELLAKKPEKTRKHIDNLRLYTSAELSLSEQALDHEVRMTVLEGIKLDLES